MSPGSQAARQEALPRLCECPQAVAPPTQGIVRTAWDYVRQLFGLLVFFLVAISANLLAGGLVWLGIAPKNPHIWRKAIAGLFKFWMAFGRWIGVVRVDLFEREVLQDLRGTIVAANHPSLVDAFALLVAVPNAVCIMRSDLQANPGLSTLARLAGYISNDRGTTLVREGIARLAKGENLVIFPEGTRTHPGPLNRFKRGFALIATRSGAKVQTVHIQLAGKFFSKGSGLLSSHKLPADLTLRLGKVFDPAPAETANEFAERLETYFRNALEGNPVPGGDT